MVGEADDIRRLVVNAILDHFVCFVACMMTTRLEMRLAVLYDARVHLPAFHALKAWPLAIMALSTSLFHHQVSRRQSVGLCCATHFLCCLNAGQKYCRMLQWEHSAILSTFMKLPFVIKIFVLSIFEWPFYTGFTVLIINQGEHSAILSTFMKLPFVIYMLLVLIFGA